MSHLHQHRHSTTQSAATRQDYPSSSDDEEDYPNLSPQERQRKISAFLLKEAVATKQHTHQGVPKAVAVDAGKWPKQSTTTTTQGGGGGKQGSRAQSATLTAGAASRGRVGGLNTTPSSLHQRPLSSNLSRGGGGAPMSASSSRPVSRNTLPNSSHAPGGGMMMGRGGHTAIVEIIGSNSNQDDDEYEVEIDEDTFQGETQFERFMREEREEEIAVGVPTRLLEEKATRRQLTAQERKNKGYELQMNERGLHSNQRGGDEWGAAGADGLVVDTHSPCRGTALQKQLQTTSSAISNEVLQMRSAGHSSTLPPKFHNDRTKFYASQQAVQRPTSATLVKHPPPPQRLAFAGSGGSRRFITNPPFHTTDMSFPPNSSPHQTRKVSAGNFGNTTFSQLRGIDGPIGQHQQQRAASAQSMRPTTASAIGGSPKGVWGRTYNGAVRVTPELHPREREPNYSCYAGEDSATVALQVEQSKANTFFSVNRRPASALRRGSPLWDTTIDDNIAVISRSAARPHSCSLRGKKEEQTVENAIRTRGVGTTTKINEEEAFRNVSLAKSKVRARLEGAAAQAVSGGQYEERQRFRAVQAHGSDNVDKPITDITAPLPQQKLINAMQRAANNNNNNTANVSGVDDNDDGGGTTMLMTRSYTPKDYVPRPVSAMSDASEALRRLLENSNTRPTSALGVNTSKVTTNNNNTRNNNTSTASSRNRNRSSSPKQEHMEEWFEHVESHPREITRKDQRQVAGLSSWNPKRTLGEETSTSKCAITVVNGKAYLSHKPLSETLEAEGVEGADVKPRRSKRNGSSRKAGAGGDDSSSSEGEPEFNQNQKRQSRQKSEVGLSQSNNNKGVQLGLRAAGDSEGSSDWEIDESDEDENKYDLNKFSSRRGSRASATHGGKGVVAASTGGNHSVIDAVEDYLLSHQQRAGTDSEHTLVTRRQQLNRLKKKQLAHKKLQQQTIRRAEHAPGVIHGAVQLPVYLTSRFSKNANITWDMSMEKPVISSDIIDAEKRRFED